MTNAQTTIEQKNQAEATLIEKALQWSEDDFTASMSQQFGEDVKLYVLDASALRNRWDSSRHKRSAVVDSNGRALPFRVSTVLGLSSGRLDFGFYRRFSIFPLSQNAVAKMIDDHFSK